MTVLGQLKALPAPTIHIKLAGPRRLPVKQTLRHVLTLGEVLYHPDGGWIGNASGADWTEAVGLDIANLKDGRHILERSGDVPRVPKVKKTQSGMLLEAQNKAAFAFVCEAFERDIVWKSEIFPMPHRGGCRYRQLLRVEP